MMRVRLTAIGPQNLRPRYTDFGGKFFMKQKNLGLYGSLVLAALSLVFAANGAMAQTLNIDDAARQSTAVDTGVYPQGVPTSYSWYNGGGQLLGPQPPPSG